MRSVRNRPALRRRSELAVFFQLSLISLGIIVGGVLGWLGNEYLNRTQVFNFSTLRMDDVPEELQPAVETLLAPALGRSLLTIDLDWMHRQLGRIPAVRTATVRRELPQTVRVAVQRRTPLARFETPTWSAAIDGDGIVLGAWDDGDLPAIRVTEAVSLDASRQLPEPFISRFADATTILNWLPQADPELARRVDHLRLDYRGVVAVFETPEWEILFGDDTRLDEKVAGMITALGDDVPPPGSLIDLRFNGQVLVAAIESAGTEE